VRAVVRFRPDIFGVTAVCLSGNLDPLARNPLLTDRPTVRIDLLVGQQLSAHPVVDLGLRLELTERLSGCLVYADPRDFPGAIPCKRLNDAMVIIFPVWRKKHRPTLEQGRPSLVPDLDPLFELA